MNKVFILGSCRTALGKMGGSLSSLSAVELGSIVIKEALQRADIAPLNVDHVYMGCVLQFALGQNVARQAAIKDGLPYSTTVETLNVVCGSGLDAINSAARLIQTGDAEVVIMLKETGDNRYLPQPMLKRMVREKKLGWKTGEGFYRY